MDNQDDSYCKVKFRKLENGSGFSLWKAKVVNGLMYLGSDQFLTAKADTTKPAEVTSQKKALAFVKDAFSDSLFRKYAALDNPKDLWDKLILDYEKVDAQLLFVRRNKFLFCKKSRSESMRDFINRLMALKQEVVEAGCAVTDTDYILTIMTGTHDEFGDFVSAMTGKQTIDKLVVDDFVGQLINEDELRKSMQHRDNKSSQGDRRVCVIKNKYGGKYDKSSNTKFVKKNQKCYNCGIAGHFASECRKPKKEKTAHEGKEYCMRENNNNNNDKRICVVGEIKSVTWKDQESNWNNKWLLDSGASTHACNSSGMFEELNPEDSSIIVGDDREVLVTGRGTVKLKMKANGVVNTLTLHDVALVPQLGVNLVSTGRLECHGLKIVTENGMSKILSECELIGCAVRTEKNPYLYEIESPVGEQILAVNLKKNSDWTLWHRRLGHLSSGYMKKTSVK